MPRNAPKNWLFFIDERIGTINVTIFWGCRRPPPLLPRFAWLVLLRNHLRRRPRFQYLRMRNWRLGHVAKVLHKSRLAQPYLLMDVHRLRFVDLEPKSINCLAFSNAAERARLAVSRADASIELWRQCDGKELRHEFTIPGRSDSTVETMAWSGERLFSSGLTGKCVQVYTCSYPAHLQMVTEHTLWARDRTVVVLCCPVIE